MARTTEIDHYALLGVSPRASADEIRAAYERLQTAYSPEHTASAAPDLQALAAEKRQQLAAAYAVLSDEARRARYDQQQGFAPRDDALLDYRPLPPARGAERARSEIADAPPPARERVPPRRGPLRLVPGLLVAAAALGILALLVLSSVRVTSGIDSVPTPTVAFLLPYSDTQIAQFNRAAESTGSFQAWAAYGTALFDNLQTLRENAPQSPQYRNQVARWLEVIAAYDRALALQDNVVIRADRAVAAFNYGTDASSQAYVEQALAEVERGIAANESEPRALLNYGLILVLNDPPRTEEALAQWRRIIEVAPDAPEAQSAQVLLESYGAGE